MKKMIMALIVLMWLAGSGWAADNETTASPGTADSESAVGQPEQTQSESAVSAPEETGHGFAHKILLYLPNRILDVFDFLRLRLRVGPGVAIGARATKLISGFIGGYTSIYAGFPGPRLEPRISLPIGFETYSGIGVSLADATTQGRTSPNYSNTEFGVSVHPIIIGLDIGVDPVEVLDLALGFLFIDIRGDDL